MTTTCGHCAASTCRECFPTPPPQDTLCAACDRMKCADCGVCGCASQCVSCGGPLSKAFSVHPGGGASCWCACVCTALVMEREAVDVDA
ncbi:hypothetical protein OG413_46020 [Streptomyces sp. NBC_01433]|uniref:hypothetical protein n=1 Tax=Streptomyces sp. NBC_01433 TaxID=2903864 RepID=UPI00225536D5|nr:hypothetical protein [Streptomyces sp. NBC_01433]MCX4682491.1 hypothetical protein [Streptomyces sp. NBC_01433]MCX4682544.1 hypothetical protein [Streptomyces sp. NBC_01433]